MAAVVTETKVSLVNDGSAQGLILSGTAVLSGGTATFTVSPGNNDVNITTPVTSKGLRDWWNAGVTCSTAENATMPAIDKVYDATNDTYTLVVTCVADQSYDWWLEGINSGR